MTSKSVKEVVDKMSLPAFVRLSRSFWDDARNGTAAEMLQFVMSQLTALTAHCRISTLELPRCQACCRCNPRLYRLAGVLANLNLTYNYDAIEPGCTCAWSCGMKRKICDMSDELNASLVAVESILLRMQEVNDTQDYHLLPGLLRELERAAGRR
jgi:hypothetical protein